jgi:hypothetical protein
VARPGSALQIDPIARSAHFQIVLTESYDRWIVPVVMGPPRTTGLIAPLFMPGKAMRPQGQPPNVRLREATYSGRAKCDRFRTARRDRRSRMMREPRRQDMKSVLTKIIAAESRRVRSKISRVPPTSCHPPPKDVNKRTSGKRREGEAWRDRAAPAHRPAAQRGARRSVRAVSADLSSQYASPCSRSSLP